MKVNNVSFGKGGFFLINFLLGVHVEMAFVLTLTVQSNIWILSILRKSLAYMWLETWDSLHTPNASG